MRLWLQTARAVPRAGRPVVRHRHWTLHLKIDPEEALRRRTRKLSAGFRHMESQAAATEPDWNRCLPLPEDCWQKAKKS